MGKTDGKLKRCRSAISIALQAQALHSTNTLQKTSEQWLETGDILLNSKSMIRHSKHMKKLHLQPNNAQIYKKKGDVLTLLKQYRDALVSINRPFVSNPISL